jgi:truncated hemoglobin YjbI
MFVDGLMPLNQSYRECIIQYRSIIALMHKFYADMRHNPKKNTLFPHTELQRLLKLSGFVANSGDGRE